MKILWNQPVKAWGIAIFSIEWMHFNTPFPLIYRTVERSRLKCGQYWPADEESAEDYGDFIVVNKKVDKRKDYTISYLTLQNIKVGCPVLVSKYLCYYL